MKTEKKLLYLLLLTVIFMSCKKEEFKFPDPNTLPAGLIGTWLETDLRSDTLTFLSNDASVTLLIVAHMNDRNITVSYPYEIKKDSIFVIDTLSSSYIISRGQNFYFKLEDPSRTMTIGNFTYRLTNKNQILTYRKIK